MAIWQRLVIVLMLAVVSLLGACSGPGTNEPKKSEVLQLVTDYKRVQMEFPDFRQVPAEEDILESARVFFTDAGYEKQMVDRSLLYYAYLAKTIKRNIELVEVTVEKMDSEKFDYAYKATIAVSDEHGESIGEHTVSGQVKLVPVDGSWRIDEEWSRQLRATRFE